MAAEGDLRQLLLEPTVRRAKRGAWDRFLLGMLVGISMRDEKAADWTSVASDLSVKGNK